MDVIKSVFGFLKIKPKESYKCTCNKTRSNEYCDTIYTLLQFTKSSKNLDVNKAKKIYQVNS